MQRSWCWLIFKGYLNSGLQKLRYCVSGSLFFYPNPTQSSRIKIVCKQFSHSFGGACQTPVFRAKFVIFLATLYLVWQTIHYV